MELAFDLRPSFYNHLIYSRSLTLLFPHNNFVRLQIQDLYFVTLLVELTDSIHVLAMPYIKYNSNTGSSFQDPAGLLGLLSLFLWLTLHILKLVILHSHVSLLLVIIFYLYMHPNGSSFLGLMPNIKYTI